MQSQSEEECAQLVRFLPPTEAALLDWAINLMADVAQMEHLNKMNARNVAMVFAPNMTQVSENYLLLIKFLIQIFEPTLYLSWMDIWSWLCPRLPQQWSWFCLIDLCLKNMEFVRKGCVNTMEILTYLLSILMHVLILALTLFENCIETYLYLLSSVNIFQI